MSNHFTSAAPLLPNWISEDNKELKTFGIESMCIPFEIIRKPFLDSVRVGKIIISGFGHLQSLTARCDKPQGRCVVTKHDVALTQFHTTRNRDNETSHTALLR